MQPPTLAGNASIHIIVGEIALVSGDTRSRPQKSNDQFIKTKD
jgi:hypothetical protein